MPNDCDVCRSFRPEANLRRRIFTRVPFCKQVVAVCDAHRRLAERSGVTTFEGIRAYYAEPGGARSTDLDR